MSRLLFEFKHEIVRQYPQITAHFSPAFQHSQDKKEHPFLQLHDSNKSNFQISKKYYQNFQRIVIYSQSSRVMKLKKTILWDILLYTMSDYSSWIRVDKKECYRTYF